MSESKGKEKGKGAAGAGRGPRAGEDRTAAGFRRALEDNLYYARGATTQSASSVDVYMALAYTVRDLLVERWRRTTDTYVAKNPKFAYYLSAEYLLGPQLKRNLHYTKTTKLAHDALAHHCRDLEQIERLDREPGLGNGGLGRLAACFLDSLATLSMPAVGYGLRYEFGIFRQRIEHGWQVESPDAWLRQGNPWEFPQEDNLVPVRFGGHTEPYTDDQGRTRVRWVAAEEVAGQPYTNLVPGEGSGTVNVLRLWGARASEEFDFQLFDEGDYARAVARKVESETLTKALYPNDGTPQGKELRLRQQYFFVACSLHDILRRFRLLNRGDWDRLPDKAAIQLNDTHPSVAILELMRILVDQEALDWDRAWDLTRRTFAYTCHTLLPEALERWPVALFERVLPRHLQILYEINQRFLDGVRAGGETDGERVARLSLIEEGPERRVRMANLAALGSFSINGVAQLHTRLLKEHTLRDFAELWPDRFNNKTNGVSPRRFLVLANPRLTELLNQTIGDGWLRDLERLRELEPYAEDDAFRLQFLAVKRKNKEDLAAIVAKRDRIEVDPASLFDVMVKRLHEYKRQLLKALHVVTLYHRIRDGEGLEPVPRTVIFGAKAAPGYRMAKLIIKLIHAIGDVVNEDRKVRDRLRVAFLADFNVSLAEHVYPAADLSEQISLAGMEASGTGNMKFALNGAVTSGTLDGANIEIRERVGANNFFLFGLNAAEARQVRERGYRPRDHYEASAELRRAIDAIAGGRFSDGDTSLFRPIVDELLENDHYLLLADYESYVDCQDAAARAFAEPDGWARRAILNTARCGYFSSDRTIREYCREIWGIEPLPPR